VFTGLVRDRATVVERSESGRDGSLRVVLERPSDWAGLRLGDSIALNGCCLTIAQMSVETLAFELTRETRDLTRFDALEVGARLHVERALQVGDRLDGHLVSGHVDGLARFAWRRDQAGGATLRFDATADLLAMLPVKGSVCVDGVSLTITACAADAFEVVLVPETLAVTELPGLRPGDAVHVEVDPLARYVAHWLNRTTE
jgi:riboflavin synthase